MRIGAEERIGGTQGGNTCKARIPGEACGGVLTRQVRESTIDITDNTDKRKGFLPLAGLGKEFAIY